MSLPTHLSRPTTPSNSISFTFRRRLLSWKTLLPVLIIGAFCLVFFSPPFLPGYDPAPHLRLPPPSVFNKDIKPPPPPIPPPFRRPGYGTPSAPDAHQSVWSGRAGQVKEAFKFAWETYKKHGFPNDEIKPLTLEMVNNFNGWGVTIYDALDTIWIMELEEIWDDAIQVVGNATFPQTEQEYAPFFETVIRYLGGLLSAYSLSGDSMLLSKAKELGTGLLGALNTTSGLPMYAVNIHTNRTRKGWTGDVLYAEALSCQLEYKFLAHASGNPEYFYAVENIMNIMYKAKVKDNAYPTRWSVQTGLPTNSAFSVGAFADSAHEYLLKQYLLSRRSEPKTRDFYLLTINAIIDKLLYITPNRELLYVTDTYAVDTPSHQFEHLSCFLPGLLALGVKTLDLSKKDRELHFWVAQGLAYTCYLTYADSATGLGPDQMKVEHPQNSKSGRWVEALAAWEKKGRPGGIPPGLKQGGPIKEPANRDYITVKDGWFLRPEVIESIFYMWKVTGDVAWRERGWEIFQSIEKYAKKDGGYASLSRVDKIPPSHKNESPSYFYAETLKYLYLMFHEIDLIPLDEYVFNTEAHPLRIFDWSELEKNAFGLSS